MLVRIIFKKKLYYYKILINFIQGINNSREHIKILELKEKYPDFIFYFLDENKLSSFKKKKIKKEITSKIPNFNNFYNELDNLYSNLTQFKSQNFTSPLKKSLKNLFSPHKKILIYNPDSEKEKGARAILTFIRAMFENNIIKFIPKHPIFDEENVKIYFLN